MHTVHAMLAAGEAVRPLLACFIEVGDLEVADVWVLTGEPGDLCAGCDLQEVSDIFG
jgi:enoyl-CoA hydratase/carnithine racemase